MSDDLIKRLRKLADDMEKHATDDWDEHEDVAIAADCIEELEREVQEAEERESIAADAAVKYLERIEKLEAACWRMQQERDRAIGWRDRDQTRAETAEAKLAKAVEVLLEADNLMAAFYSNGNVTERHLRACNAGVAYEKSHTILAELEGK